ncbi:MAG: hypothetical protein LBI28_00225 [Treponema sp.]|jgi:hypothetical protein|nr:hypothetical protein [Treponema sp.]
MFLFLIYIAVGITALVIIGNIIMAIINHFSGKGKKDTVSVSFQYQGKDANGKDKFEMRYPGGDPHQENSGSGAPSRGMRYMGKDEYGRDKFEMRS